MTGPGGWARSEACQLSGEKILPFTWSAAEPGLGGQEQVKAVFWGDYSGNDMDAHTRATAINFCSLSNSVWRPRAQTQR